MLCALLPTCTAVFAQSDEGDAEETSAEPSLATPSPDRPRVREAGPETYYQLLDGELVPVLVNFPFEDIDLLLEIYRGLTNPEPPPTYTIEELLIAGTANGLKADLTATVTIRALRDGRVRVPLRFSGAHLRELPEFDGDGVPVVLREEDDGGLVCWIQAPKDTSRSLSMKLIAPLRKIGRETRLVIDTPKASSSEMSLLVPVPISELTADTSSGDMVRREQGEGSLLLVTGIAETEGDTEVTWQQGSAEPTRPRPLLEVRSETLVTVEEMKRVTSDVTLHVSSLRSQFSTFEIRIPAGSHPFRTLSNQSNVQFTESVDDSDGSKAKLIQVKLDQLTAGPVDVQLRMDITPEGNGNIAEFEAGGIEVEEALRQSGEINLVVKGDLSVDPMPGRNVQQTRVPDSRREKKVYAHFQYGDPSHSLRIQLSKETQVNVEPVYLLYVESNRVALDAKLKYKIRGADVSEVSVNLPGWQLGGVSPDTVVDGEKLDRENLAPLKIPLTPTARTESGEFELQISAVLPISDAAAPLSIPLPRPDARMLTPATVVVLPADNVELAIEEGTLQGLEPDSFPPDVKLPTDRQQAPLFYRERGDSTSTAFAPGFQVRQRAISVSSESDLEVDLQRVSVEQRLSYRIAYEPIRNVRLVVPRAVLETGDLRILCDGRGLMFEEVEKEEGETETDQDSAAKQNTTALIQVDLLKDWNDPCDLDVAFEQALPGLPAGPNATVEVPLVVPAASEDTTFAGSELHLLSAEDVQVGVEGGNWRPAMEDVAAPDGTLTVVSRAIPTSVPLRVASSTPRSRTSTVISQAWIQTWLNSVGRRDRAVFRITTNERRIEVRLPEQAEVRHVALDGREVPGSFSGTEPIPIELDDVTSPTEHVVEIWYWLPRLRRSLGEVTMEAPVIADAKWAKRLYWQLATPRDEHLLHTPAGMTPELTWKWRGMFWVRSARLEQSDLENLTGASPQTPVPDTLNQYLFSSFGEISNPECTTASRRDIVLALSGCALVIGLLLIYVPVLRHPGLLFAGGIALLTAMMCYPELAVGLVQASCLGLALVLGACLLKWAVDAREARRSLVQGATYTSPDSNTIRAAEPEVDSSSFPTTVTGPAPSQASAEESET